MRRFCVPMLSLLVIVLFPLEKVYSRPDVIQYPFLYNLQPVDSIKGPGKATYEFTIWNNPRFPKDDSRCKDEIVLRLTTHDRLVNLGPSEWQIKPIGTEKVSILIQIDIPDKDTTGFTLVGPCWISPSPRYFVTTGYFSGPNKLVPIEFFSGDPRDPANVLYKEEWEQTQDGWQPKERQGATVKFVDSLGHEVEPPSDSLLPKTDSTTQPYIKTEVFHHNADSLKRAKIEREKQHQAELELSPLVGQQYEYLIVEGQMLMRKEGEYKFYPAEGAKVGEALIEDEQRRGDSILVARDHIFNEVWLDLRDPDLLVMATKLLDSLQPTDTAGIYRAKINRRTWLRLTEEGISVRKWNDTLSIRKAKEAKQPVKNDRRQLRNPLDHSSLQASPTDILFTEGFDAGMSSGWAQNQDTDPGCGYDTWGDVSCFKLNGARSAWCNGQGGQPPCDEYSCRMISHLVSIPIDIAGRTNIELRYSLYSDVEDGVDWTRVMFKIDTFQWQILTYFYGLYLWDEYIHTIPSGGNTLSIQFEFHADGLNEAWYGGAFLDDISVSADPPPKPNLVPFKPSGWSEAVVASSVSGTHTNTSLWGYDLSYFDWAYRNSGVVDAGPFVNKLIIDGTTVWTQNVSGLVNNDFGSLSDFTRTLSPDWHQIQLLVDANNSIDEANEDDNVFTIGYTWYPPTITVSGTARYWDMNPPPSLLPLRNTPIVLRDADGSNSEKLDSTVTNDFGQFSFIPASNRETNGDFGQQELFLRAYASNNAAYSSNLNSNVAISLSTSPLPGQPNGQVQINFTSDTATSKYFYPIDVMKSARDQLLYYPPNLPPGGRVRVVIANDSGTYLDPNNMSLYFNSSQNDGYFFPDTYDRDVIEHEYAHWVSYNVLFFSSSTDSIHQWKSYSSRFTAASEGWAHFFDAWASNSPSLLNKATNYTRTYSRNAETGQCDTNGIAIACVTNWSDSCEGAVAGFLWDICDAANDDYATFGILSGCNIPDNVGDTLSCSVSNVFDVLTSTSRLVNGHHPQTISEFWTAWFTSPSLGHDRAMGDIWYEHGDSTHFNCCRGTTGDINMSGNVDLTDLAMLVAYMTVTPRPVLPCPREADVNASGIIDLADLSLLIAYLGQPPRPTLPNCPL